VRSKDAVATFLEAILASTDLVPGVSSLEVSVLLLYRVKTTEFRLQISEFRVTDEVVG